MHLRHALIRVLVGLVSPVGSAGKVAMPLILLLLAARPAVSQAVESYKVTVTCDGHASIDHGQFSNTPMLILWKVSAKAGATDAGALVGMELSSTCVGYTSGGTTEVVLTATGANAVEFMGSCFDQHLGVATVKAMNSGRLSFPKKFTTMKVAACFQDGVGHNGQVTISISRI